MISGAAERVAERIHALVYLDAFVFQDGQSLHDTLPPAQKAMQLELAQQHGEGWKTPPIPAAVFNVNASDREWVDRQRTMQSLATFQQSIKLSGRADSVRNTTFILASGWKDSPFPVFYERARVRVWRTLSIDCGHDVMLDRPDELTTILVDVAESQPVAI